MTADRDDDRRRRSAAAASCASVWVSMRDEEPPDRGLAALMAAARVQGRAASAASRRGGSASRAAASAAGARARDGHGAARRCARGDRSASDELAPEVVHTRAAPRGGAPGAALEVTVAARARGPRARGGARRRCACGGPSRRCADAAGHGRARWRAAAKRAPCACGRRPSGVARRARSTTERATRSAPARQPRDQRRRSSGPSDVRVDQASGARAPATGAGARRGGARARMRWRPRQRAPSSRSTRQPAPAIAGEDRGAGDARAERRRRRSISWSRNVATAAGAWRLSPRSARSSAADREARAPMRTARRDRSPSAAIARCLDRRLSRTARPAGRRALTSPIRSSTYGIRPRPARLVGQPAVALDVRAQPLAASRRSRSRRR